MLSDCIPIVFSWEMAGKRETALDGRGKRAIMEGCLGDGAPGASRRTIEDARDRGAANKSNLLFTGIGGGGKGLLPRGDAEA